MPTPVSALLHAATLVAGGTYLLLRCSAIVGASSVALILAAVVGTITAILAASTALFQHDAKRIIAFSTMSQFGYLTASIGLGQTNSTLFHLSSHSGFKALLFITAGGVIHATTDEQDIRRLGGLITSLPFTYCGMLIGSLSLIATPYLAGFYSKDLILELAITQCTVPGTWMWLLGSLVAGITACYSIRLLSYIYLGTPTGPRKTYEMAHEQPLGIIIPIVILSILAITFGYIAREAAVGIGNSLSAEAGTRSSVSYLIEADFGLSLWTKNWPLICTISGVLFGLIFFVWIPTLKISSLLLLRTNRQTEKENRNTVKLGENPFISFPVFLNNAPLVLGLSNKWWIDAIYARVLSWPGLFIGLLGSKIIDRGVLELIGPAGFTSIFLGSFSSASEKKKSTDANLTIWSISNLTRSLISHNSVVEQTHPVSSAYEKKDSSSWIGTTLPDYSSYIVVFTLVTIVGILFINPITNTVSSYLLSLVLGFIIITSTPLSLHLRQGEERKKG